MLKKVSYVLAVLFVIIILGPRIDRSTDFTPKELPSELTELGSYLENQELNYNVTLNQEKRIIWNSDIEKTEYSVVYLHGFTANRQEITPVAETVAQKLGANYFATRFKGHGIDKDAYKGVKFADWLEDLDEAIKIGNMIGEKTIIIATSTGAPIAMNADQSKIYANIWVSPNFYPANPLSFALLMPWGQQLAYILEGEYRNIGEAGEHHTSAVFPMMAAVDSVENKDFSNFTTPTLMFISDYDKTVSPEKMFAGFKKLNSSLKKLIVYNNSTDKGNHVITGNINSPNSNELFINEMYNFIKSVELEEQSR